MASHKFLNQKAWHPSNKTNQKLIWIAEQKAKDKEIREKQAAKEIHKQLDMERFKKIAKSRGDTETIKAIESKTMEFMYAPPPGLISSNKAPKDDIMINEDDAVREFKRKFEQATESKKRKTIDHSGASATDNNEDKRFVQRNLERYVGRRPQDNLTLENQVERFPFLKNAPVEGQYTSNSNIKVNFKPVGISIRNVRCARCGEWGHQSGDRECELRDQNPHDAERRDLEDPMSNVNKVNAVKKQELVLKQAAQPLEMIAGTAGSYDLVSSGDDSSDAEWEFLASLSSKEKKLLLKKLKSIDKKKSKKKTEKEKKTKKRSKKHK